MPATFKENLIKELGLEKLPLEKQSQILLTAGRIIQQNVILRILDELKEKDKKEFDQLLKGKKDDEEAVVKFFRSKIPNFDKIVAEEIEKFQTSSLETINKAMQGK